MPNSYPYKKSHIPIYPLTGKVVKTEYNTTQSFNYKENHPLPLEDVTIGKVVFSITIDELTELYTKLNNQGITIITDEVLNSTLSNYARYHTDTETYAPYEITTAGDHEQNGLKDPIITMLGQNNSFSGILVNTTAFSENRMDAVQIVLPGSYVMFHPTIKSKPTLGNCYSDSVNLLYNKLQRCKGMIIKSEFIYTSNGSINRQYTVAIIDTDGNPTSFTDTVECIYKIDTGEKETYTTINS